MTPSGRDDEPNRRQFRLTERDIEMLKAVYEYRGLIAPQVEALFFPHDPKRVSTLPSAPCYKRLAHLVTASYLQRAEVPHTKKQGSRPYVYQLASKGADLVAAMYGVSPQELDWRPRDTKVLPPFLDHLIDCNTVRIAFTLAGKEHGLVIEDWKDDRTLKRENRNETVTIAGPSGKDQATTFIPDGYFVINQEGQQKRARFFLEVDRATITAEASVWGRRDWKSKILAYLAYQASGKFQARYGAPRFAMLTVTTSEKRLETLKAVTEDAGGGVQFWFTTLDQVTPKAVLTAPIWRVATRQEPFALFPG